MKRVLKWIGAMVLVLVALLLALAAHTCCAKPLSVNWFYTRVFAQFALDNPELLTRLRMLEPLGIRGHNARLADSSPAEMERAYVRLKADYAILKDYDSSNYTGQDRLSYEILEYFIGTQMRGALLPEYSSPGGLRWRERQ